MYLSPWPPSDVLESWGTSGQESCSLGRGRGSAFETYKLDLFAIHLSHSVTSCLVSHSQTGASPVTMSHRLTVADTMSPSGPFPALSRFWEVPCQSGEMLTGASSLSCWGFSMSSGWGTAPWDRIVPNLCLPWRSVCPKSTAISPSGSLCAQTSLGRQWDSPMSVTKQVLSKQKWRQKQGSDTRHIPCCSSQEQTINCVLFLPSPIQLRKQGEEKYKDHLRKPLHGVWVTN